MRARHSVIVMVWAGIAGSSAFAAPFEAIEIDRVPGPPAAVPRSTVLNINIAGMESWDQLGHPANHQLIVDMAALLGQQSGTSVTITGMGWNINLTTISPSWLSEATIDIRPVGAAPGSGFQFAAGQGDNFAGTGTYASTVQSMASLGGSNIVLPTGQLNLEFYETFDDFPNQADATYHSTLSFEVVPEPTTFVLMLALAFRPRSRSR